MTDSDKARLIESRWNSSETIFDTVTKLYDTNLKIYTNNGSWTSGENATRKKTKVRANRIFRDTDSVINSLIANPLHTTSTIASVISFSDKIYEQLVVKMHRFSYLFFTSVHGHVQQFCVPVRVRCCFHLKASLQRHRTASDTDARILLLSTYSPCGGCCFHP